MKNKAGEKLLLTLFLVPFGVVIHGFVLSKLWELFIVSTFNINSISVMQAAGLMLVIDFILMKIEWANHAEEADYHEYITKMISHQLVSPFVILGIGYILNMFL